MNSFYTSANECSDCGCKLWSEYAKQIRLCPECENVDFDDLQDIETVLESIEGI